MFKAIDVLCVVDVEVEFEHGGGEKYPDLVAVHNTFLPET